MPTPRDTFISNLLRQGDGEVPVWSGFSPATWMRHGDRLMDLLERYPDFPTTRQPRGTDFRTLFGPACRAGESYTDNWGCRWECIRDGMEGIIAEHPLADIARLKNYRAPDPLIYSERGVHDWGAFARGAQWARANGHEVGLHGERFFERVHFLRGMEAALMDLADGTPEIQEIIDLVLDYNLAYMGHAFRLAAPMDVVNFGDDWGSQHACMISPATFRRYFKPGYARMYALCKQNGALTTQHSDGHTVELWDEFLEAGLSAFNMQVNCVGVDVIEQRLKGRMCIIADIDRQHILPVGTPAQVHAHIAEVVTRLGSPTGGLILRIDIYPDVPLENIEALIQAVEEFRHYWCRKG